MKTQNCTNTMSPPEGAAARALAGLDQRLPSPATVVAAAWRTLIRWQRRHDYRWKLARMEDRLLADIGMTREQADTESRKPFWRA